MVAMHYVFAFHEKERQDDDQEPLHDQQRRVSSTETLTYTNYSDAASLAAGL